MASPTVDPHANAPEVAGFVHRGADATHEPDVAHMLSEEHEAIEANCTLMLPKIFLIRHGQSLFNAMYSAYAELTDKGQARIKFGAGAGASSSSESNASRAPVVEEGTMIAGLPVLRSRKPMSDARLLDAPLTPHGQSQALEASKKARGLGPIDLVLSTPLTRAIQTSLLVFRPKANSIDWTRASVPSLDQPLNASHDVPPFPLPEKTIPIRVVPYHVENLCASCDVGIPLSFLEQRFSAEPNLDFETCRSMMSDCWWTGADVGANVSHLVIKRPSVGASSAAAAAAASGSAAAASSSARPASSSAGKTSRPVSASRATITLKPTSAMPSSGLMITREQSSSIEARTQKLILYLLNLALAHAEGPDSYRPMHVALVGHCGYFARLSGHSLENCEIVELEWATVLQRASIKGFLSLPAGYRTSDCEDVRKHAVLIRHWIRELSPPGASVSTSSSVGAGAAHYSAMNPPPSSNTADLNPVWHQ